MKPSALFEALHALIGQRVPLHIWGACGVGKSQIVAQVAADLKWQFLDVRAVQLDPVDLRGLPRISADQAEWVPPKFLPTSGNGILFLDELTSAPQMTQAGCNAPSTSASHPTQRTRPAALEHGLRLRNQSHPG
jgi:MoxR-like ATPase